MGILNRIKSFFGGSRYRRYGGMSALGAPLVYGLTRWFRGRRANRLSA